MGFKKDFHAFKERVDLFIHENAGKNAATEVALRQCQTIIEEQRKQIQDLLDRLMARGLPELKTYTLPDGTLIPPYEYRMSEDEDLAGDVVEEDSVGTTGQD